MIIYCSNIITEAGAIDGYLVFENGVITDLVRKDVEELKVLHTDLCMECGSCSFVCPAKRPVAQTMKEAKDFLRKAGN